MRTRSGGYTVHARSSYILQWLAGWMAGWRAKANYSYCLLHVRARREPDSQPAAHFWLLGWLSAGWKSAVAAGQPGRLRQPVLLNACN